VNGTNLMCLYVHVHQMQEDVKFEFEALDD